MVLLATDLERIATAANATKSAELEQHNFKMNHRITAGDVRIVLETYERLFRARGKEEE